MGTRSKTRQAELQQIEAKQAQAACAEWPPSPDPTRDIQRMTRELRLCDVPRDAHKELQKILPTQDENQNRLCLVTLTQDPGYLLFRQLLGKDVLKLTVGPMNLGVVSIMRDKGLGDPAINRCISWKLRWNNGMEVMTLVDYVLGICFKFCLPGPLFCVYIGVILGLWGCNIILYWFHTVQLVYHYTIVVIMIVTSADDREILMTTLSRLEGHWCNYRGRGLWLLQLVCSDTQLCHLGVMGSYI